MEGINIITFFTIYLFARLGMTFLLLALEEEDDSTSPAELWALDDLLELDFDWGSVDS